MDLAKLIENDGTKQNLSPRKVVMKGIGYRDIESYVRTLVSEGLGKQSQAETGKTELPGDPPSKEQPSATDHPVNDNRNGAGI